VKEGQNSSDSPSSSVTATPPGDDLSFSNDRLMPIDLLTVDKHSRLTLTKKFKKIIPLRPDDKIMVYQDAYNKNLILKIQQQEKVVDSWVLVRGKKGDSKGSSRSNGDNIKKTHAATDINNKENNTFSSVPILLVDDEEDLLKTFTFFLKDEGYSNVKTFSDSRNVLKHLLDMKNSSFYRLAIIDIRMPDINGIQLYQILKTLSPTIKIIFITAMDAADELTSIYTEIKTADILRKPIEQNRFIEAVNDKVSTLEIP
jgi:CheY-like chemotaxis protein